MPVRVTPLVAAPLLGAGVHLKLENLQRTGSFKLRGALARLTALAEAERARGVVTASAGNHGMGVALAARLLDVRAVVFVSRLTPDVKRRGIEQLGATVIVDGANYDEAEAVARTRAEDTGAVFVSAYDDEHVIAGNGDSLGQELLAQAPSLAQVVCPVGGGGMIAGLARTLMPRGIDVIGVQPAVNCAMHDSLAAGRALTVYAGGATIAEGCEGAVAERTFAFVRDHGVRVARLDESAIRRAVATCYRQFGVIAEPSAAVAVAGLLEHTVAPSTRGMTAVIVSGGNIEPALLDEILDD
jgi:threonine dehydratase